MSDLVGNPHDRFSHDKAHMNLVTTKPVIGTSKQPLFVLFVLRLNVPVNNFSVMSGQCHRFLGITSTFGE